LSALFSGLGVALATPFSAEGALDLPALRTLVARVVAGGAKFLVPLGTTGEAATLDEEERELVIRAVLASANGLPVLAGCGSNSTAVAARWVTRARELGAQGALVVTPYYNKPTPEGQFLHFKACADAAPRFPIVAYNVPGRTAVNMSADTILRVLELPEVVAVKESSGNLVQIAEVARRLPQGKTLLAGDDNLALPSIAVGATGLVSVLGNVRPSAIAELLRAALAGERERAQALHARLLPLMEALFVESNPIPVKCALALEGLGTASMRLPLTPARESTRTLLQRLLRDCTDDAA
jgi:4-hydroxy-tetrahydrodipicolinate synthase